MKRQLTSFDISIIVQDLQEIIDSPIDKSYQLSSNEILIKFKNKKTMKKEALFIRNGELIALTEKQLKTPKTPSNFVMALRKYIQNGRIVEIVQHEFDRILMIKIGKKTGIFTLVIEFFSDGNIILVDEKGDIIIPFIQQAWAHRKVKGRQPYTPPPSQINPFNLTKETFKECLKESHADVVRTLAVKLQLSGPIAEEILTYTTVKKETLAANITEKDIDQLYESLQRFLIRFIKKEYDPISIKNNENIVDILPFSFKSYTQQTMESIDHFTRGLSAFIDDEQTRNEQKPPETKTDKVIGKLTRMLDQQKEKIVVLDKTIETKQREGEIIYLHYNTVDELLCFIQKKMEEKEKKDTIDAINALKGVKDFNPQKNRLIILSLIHI